MINVPMPRVQVLHTVSLVTIAEDGSRGTTKMMALGDVLVTELVIKHTRRWDGRHRHYHQERPPMASRQCRSTMDTTREKMRKMENGKEPRNESNRKKSTDVTSYNGNNNSNNHSNAVSEPADDSTIESRPGSIEFIYEIRADPDNKWLVSGQRRTRFTMKMGCEAEDEVHRFRVFLIPLVTGELLFPSVEINVFEEPKYLDLNHITRDDGDDGYNGEDRADTGSGIIDDGSSSKNPTITCDTNYLNRSESIVVVPNIKSCTVGIGFSEAGLEAGDDESGAGAGKGEKDDQAMRKKQEEEEDEEDRDRLRAEKLVETKLLDVEYRTGGFP